MLVCHVDCYYIRVNEKRKKVIETQNLFVKWANKYKVPRNEIKQVMRLLI